MEFDLLSTQLYSLIGPLQIQPESLTIKLTQPLGSGRMCFKSEQGKMYLTFQLLLETYPSEKQPTKLGALDRARVWVKQVTHSLWSTKWEGPQIVIKISNFQCSHSKFKTRKKIHHEQTINILNRDKLSLLHTPALLCTENSHFGSLWLIPGPCGHCLPGFPQVGV